MNSATDYCAHSYDFCNMDVQGGLLTNMHALHKKIQYCDDSGRWQTLFVPPMVLADSAFGLEKWQMTPYKGESGSGSIQERRFNWIHSSARVIVEHAFGRLKGRFRLLLHTHKTSWQLGTHSIMAAMVLHNFLGQQNDVFLRDWAEGVEELEGNHSTHPQSAGPGNDGEVHSAVELKKGLTNFYMQRGHPARRRRNR